MNHALRKPPGKSVDPVVRLIITHWVLGAALGIFCAAVALWLDVFRLRSMLFGGDHIVWEGVLLLFGGFAFTFSGVVCASAVMNLPRDDDGPDGGHAAADPAPQGTAGPAPVLAAHPTRHRSPAR